MKKIISIIYLFAAIVAAPALAHAGECDQYKADIRTTDGRVLHMESPAYQQCLSAQWAGQIGKASGLSELNRKAEREAEAQNELHKRLYKYNDRIIMKYEQRDKSHILTAAVYITDTECQADEGSIAFFYIGSTPTKVREGCAVGDGTNMKVNWVKDSEIVHETYPIRIFTDVSHNNRLPFVR